MESKYNYVCNMILYKIFMYIVYKLIFKHCENIIKYKQ